MRQRLCCFLTALFLAAVPAYAAKRAFSIEDVYRFRHIDDLHLSPDGRTIVVTIGSYDLGKAKHSSHIWLLDADGGNARQFTFGEANDASPVFSPDGKWIAFIREAGGEGQLYVIAVNGGGARKVTDVSTGTVRDLTPGDFDSPRYQLAGPLQYDFSPDSKELVVDSDHGSNPESSTNSDLWIVSVDGSQPARDVTASNPAFDGNPKYSPDGKYIAYLLQKQPGYESDLFRLALYDRASGTSRVLTESFRNWVQDFQWASDSKSIFFTAPVEGDNPIFGVT